MENSESQVDSQHAPANLPEIPSDPQLQDLVPFVAGNKIFAVFVEHVEGTAEAKVPAALPRSPAAVLGVVCARGRMLTVLDPVALVGGEARIWPKRLPCVIALRGEEQLALAAEESRDTVTIAAADIEPWKKFDDDGAESAILGVAWYGGEQLTILNVDQIYAVVVRRKERRRRRF